MSYLSEVLADAPLGYWRLGEPSGLTMADSSGNNRSGTYGGAGLMNLGTPGLLAGDTDTAVTFNGRGGVVSFGSWMSVNYMTAEAIIKPSSLSGLQEVISHDQIGTGAQPAWRVRLNGTKVEWLHWGSAGTTVAQGSTVLTAGNVYHLAMTFNGTTLIGYVNGVVDYSVAKTGTTLQPSTPLSVGVLGDGSSEPFHGVIDEAAFYGTALSSARIAAHYAAATSGAAPTALTGTWGLVG